MFSNFRPYIIKAVYNWLSDNDSKIYIKVNTLYSDLDVPSEHIDPTGHIILNISHSAIGEIDTNNNKSIIITMRFNGDFRELDIDYNSINAIYDPNSNQGHVFEPIEPPKEEKSIKKDTKDQRAKTKLRIVD